MPDAPEPESAQAATADLAEADAAELSGERPVPAFTHEADEVLLGATALAQRALLEVTPPETVGSMVGHVAEGEHVLSLHFAADLTGYPGWHWSVTLARVDDGEPTVVGTELLPGERALLAPEWVPWSDRLADYRAAQAAVAAEAGERGDEDAGDDPAGFDDDGGAEGPDDETFSDDADESDDDDLFDGIDIDALGDPESDDDSDDETGDIDDEDSSGSAR